MIHWTHRSGGRIASVVMCLLAAVGLCCNASADPTFAPGISQGNVTATDIVEASGVAASRTNNGVLWVHNDSGDSARVFAIDAQGQLLGTYNLTDATAVDFEDIAVGPGPQAEVSYIYIGDIGDNSAKRTSITAYRVVEPAVYTRQSAAPVVRNLNQGEWQAITLQYPDGAHNAETLLVDPQTGDLFVCSKQSGVTRVYRATAAQLVSGATVVMSYVGQVSVDTSTGGDISATGADIAIRGYGLARLWTRAAGQSVADALTGTPIAIPLVSEPQGEALGFDAIGSGYFTLSEGHSQPLYYFTRTSGDGPATPTTLVAAGSSWKYLDNGSNQGVTWRQPAFDDAAWATGDGQLGYGDGDEQTVVGYGPDSGNKYVTTYFRKTFQVDPSLVFDSLRVRLLFDDGAAVYLNGTEIVRVNLAAGASYSDWATGTQYAMENAWFTFSVDPNLLVSGTNVLCVEVHQVNGTSSDFSFDLQLLGEAHVQTVRLNLTETNAPWGDVEISPEPNDPNAPEFPRGTTVTLTAHPIEGRGLRQWDIFDPNHPDDANFALADSNLTTTLVLYADTHVDVAWKCSSDVAPVLPVVLLGWVGLWGVRRRL